MSIRGAVGSTSICPRGWFACESTPFCYTVTSYTIILLGPTNYNGLQSSCASLVPGAALAVLNTAAKMDGCVAPNIHAIGGEPLIYFMDLFL